MRTTMCSTSMMLRVRWLAGISSARALLAGKDALTAPEAASFRNVRRLVGMKRPPGRNTIREKRWLGGVESEGYGELWRTERASAPSVRRGGLRAVAETP